MVKLHRLPLIEQYILESKDLTLEAKKDLDDLKSYLGDKLFDDYMKIRDRIPKDQNEFKDFNKLKKMDKKDIQNFVSSFQSKSDKKKSDKQKGAEKLYEDSDWVVYRITTYPAAQLYGKGTKWCITGRYPGHEERGQKYFDDYINDENLDGGYYFYISKEDPDDKYCLLQGKDGKVKSVWEPTDENVGNTGWTIPSSFPKVPGINIDPKPFKALFLTLIRSIKDRNFSDVRDVVKQMKKNNVSLDDSSPTTEPPLYEAVRLGLLKVASYLIDSGADINVKNDVGRTPLFIASTIPMINMLIEKGADVNIKDNNGDFCYKLIERVYKDSFSDIISLLWDKADLEFKSSYIKDHISISDLNKMVENGIISKQDYINFYVKISGYDNPVYLSDMDPDTFISGITSLKPKDKMKLKNLILKYLSSTPDIKNKKVTVDNINSVSSRTLLDFLVREFYSDDIRGRSDIYNFLYKDLITDYYSKQFGTNAAKNSYDDKEYFTSFISSRDSREDILQTLESGGINMDRLISFYDKYINIE